MCPRKTPQMKLTNSARTWIFRLCSQKTRKVHFQTWIYKSFDGHDKYGIPPLYPTHGLLNNIKEFFRLHPIAQSLVSMMYSASIQMVRATELSECLYAGIFYILYYISSASTFLSSLQSFQNCGSALWCYWCSPAGSMTFSMVSFKHACFQKI